MRLKVKFRLNKNLDKEVTLRFIGLKQGRINFSRGIIDVHPELRSVAKMRNVRERKRAISKYFDSFYKEHSKYLKKRVLEIARGWRKIESRFFSEARKIFKSYPFPKGKYIGYISIIDCNPRFLKNKTFQLFHYKPRNANYIIAHELLHFIFYDYATSKYPELFKKLNTESGIFWDLAEIFNVIILSSSNFAKLHRKSKIEIYPELGKYVRVLRKYWENEKSIDRWLIKSYEYLKGKRY